MTRLLLLALSALAVAAGDALQRAGRALSLGETAARFVPETEAWDDGPLADVIDMRKREET